MRADGGFDVVYISIPLPLHYLHAKTALTYKRNVLLNKRVVMNREQYARMVTLADKRSVVLMEAMWTRYLPATKYLQETLLLKISHVHRVFFDFSFPLVDPELPISSRFLERKAGVGVLLDQGVYAFTWIDLALSASRATKALIPIQSVMIRERRTATESTRSVSLDLNRLRLRRLRRWLPLVCRYLNCRNRRFMIVRGRLSMLLAWRFLYLSHTLDRSNSGFSGMGGILLMRTRGGRDC